MKKKLFCLLLAAALCLGLAACGETEPTFSSGEVQQGLSYTASGISPDAAAMTIDGKDVRADVYLYLLAYNAGTVDSYMAYQGKELDWDELVNETETAREYVLTDALNAVKYFAAIEALAARNGITMDQGGQDALAALREQNIAATGSEENYLKELDLMGLTEDGWNAVCTAQYLYEMLIDACADAPEGSELSVSDATLDAYVESQGYVTADHLLLLTMDMTTYTAYDDEKIAAQKALAEDLLAQLKAYDGDDLAAFFTQLADQYSEDTGRLYNPTGYTFTSGEMVEQFEQAAFALADGALSGIVETPYGYHIILRKPLDTTAARAAAREACVQSVLEEKITAISDAAVVEMNPAVEALDLAQFYETVRAAQEAYYNSDTADTTDGTGDTADTAAG